MAKRNNHITQERSKVKQKQDKSHTEAVSTCPSRAEMWSGVYPLVVAASGWAMCCSSSCTISVFPRRDAMWSGVWSSWGQREGTR
ncbi:hypothetical protein EYF80_046869 [Liparis tanakae]|uniref:Uncharacterized protein n=1 Tax=Liparis tanakae TaxID=230148 RepID=A0A4Z2FP60_9TELE|nr:hypothetical protein EYF80_046869 [Liparis tanakae]